MISPFKRAADSKLSWVFRQSLPLCVFTSLLLFLATTGIYYSTGRNTPWPHLFYVPIIVAAALLGYWGALAASLAAGLMLGVFLIPEPDIGRSEAFNIALYRFLFYLLVGETAAFLFRQARALEASETTGARRLGELEGFHQIDQAILTTPDLDAVTQTIVSVTAHLAGAKMCTLRLVDQDFRHLSLAASYGVSPAYLEGHRKVFGEAQRIGEGVAGWTVMTGQPTVVRDIFQDPRLERLQALHRENGIRSQLSAPIILSGKVLGAMTVMYPEVRQFSQDEVGQLTRLGTQMALAIQNAQQFLRIKNFTRETVIMLAEAIEERDPFSGGHCRRLGTLARTLSQTLGLSAAEQEQIEYAAYLHDIGKIVVPDSILLKPGPLTPQEGILMRNHAFIGSQLAKKVSFLEPMAPIIYHHHERYDGTGYLDGLAGEGIPLGARIIAVVDAFDAMTNDRPYRKALPWQEALQELKQSAGTQLDPGVMEAFLKGIKETA